MHRKKSSSLGLILFLLVVAGIFGGVYFLNHDPRFEKIKPVINMDKEIFWNPKNKLEVEVSDNYGLKNIEVFIEDGDNKEKVLDINLAGEKSYKVQVNFPKKGILAKDNLLKLTIVATDKSFWQFFRGNKQVKKAIVTIDKKRPELTLINNSYSITKGGSGVAIFRVKDKSLKSLYIETSFGKKFYPNPFYKKDYYISLFAWPIFQKNFRAWVVAVDKAGNKTKQYIPLYIKDRNYKVSFIKAKDSFIDGKISTLAEDRPEKTKDMNRLQKLNFVNATYRVENEDLIRKVTTPVDNSKITNFNIKRFYPLKNGAVVGTYGDHRYYYYQTKDNVISESYHMGVDFASVKHGKIKTSNKALVVFAEYNGIYGNNLILYHGLGLYSLYGHCSGFLVQKGDIVKAGTVVAKTGKTGLALGDHLHFGLMVQGVMVRPAEWMDQRWIKTHITDIISKAKKIIGN